MSKQNNIDKNNVEEILSLTDLQQGILYHYIKNPNSSEYHEQLSLSLICNFNVEKLQMAWNSVIENNEMLRTIFRWEKLNKPIAIVLKKHKINMEYYDLEENDYKEEELNKIKLEDLNNRFDISSETLRIYLCKLKTNKYEMIISNHHILYDGWSNGIILKELFHTYTLLEKDENILPYKKPKFNEFVKYLNKNNKDMHRKYWNQYLENFNKNIQNNQVTTEHNKKEISHKFNHIFSKNIINFVQSNGISLSSFFYGIWALLTSKLTDEKDIVFGTTVSGRPEHIEDVDKIVGLFINTIPLRIRLNRNYEIIKILQDINKDLYLRKIYENTSLIDIKKACNIKGNQDLFDNIVIIENYPIDIKDTQSIKIDNFNINESINYKLSLEILTFKNIEFRFKYDANLIDSKWIERICGFLDKIIKNILSNNTINVSQIN